MKERILKKMQDVLNDKSIVLNYDSVLSDLLDSITFMKMVVALEGEFDIEFDEKILLIENFPTVDSMINYVESKIST
jgi:acyl carrier protein